MKPLLALVALLTLPACTQPDEPEAPVAPGSDAGIDAPFVFAMTGRAPLDVALRTPAGPLAGATGWLRVPDPLGGQAVAWTGISDRDGHLRGDLDLPATAGAVELVVQAPGWRGPHTDPARRAMEGDFAPSARVEVAPGALRGLTLTFEVR